MLGGRGVVCSTVPPRASVWPADVSSPGDRVIRCTTTSVGPGGAAHSVRLVPSPGVRTPGGLCTPLEAHSLHRRVRCSNFSSSGCRLARGHLARDLRAEDQWTLLAHAIQSGAPEQVRRRTAQSRGQHKVVDSTKSCRRVVLRIRGPPGARVCEQGKAASTVKGKRTCTCGKGSIMHIAQAKRRASLPPASPGQARPARRACAPGPALTGGAHAWRGTPPPGWAAPPPGTGPAPAAP